MECNEYRKLQASFSVLPLPRSVWDTPEFEAWQAHGLTCKHCAEWLLVQRCAEMGISVADFPCVHMAYEASRVCESHANKSGCPDMAIIYDARFDEYSIGPRGGGGDYVLISFCPFCGVVLPKSKRDRYFDELERLRLDIDDDLPEAYLDDSWWK